MTIAILMLNLLIAVLSTVQEAIQEQVHTEFQRPKPDRPAPGTCGGEGSFPAPVRPCPRRIVDFVGELWNLVRVLWSRRPNACHQGFRVAPVGVPGTEVAMQKWRGASDSHKEGVVILAASSALRVFRVDLASLFPVPLHRICRLSKSQFNVHCCSGHAPIKAMICTVHKTLWTLHARKVVLSP